MNELAEFCQSLKQDVFPKKQNPQQPVRWWTEPDRFDNKIVDAFVMIFRTRGCSWARSSGCFMCGYFNESLWNPVSAMDLKKQYSRMINDYDKQPIVKIFTSGSFLDEKEIPRSIRKHVLQHLSKTTDKICVESRPEYITNDVLKPIKEDLDSTQFEIGIGLETANDFIRTHAINKGFTFSQYHQVVDRIKRFDFTVKTYVLVKPPFVTEQEALDDTLFTVKQINGVSDTISINPTNVQRNTVVEYLWKRNQYRPPWLWSIVKILSESCKKTRSRLQCDIAGGGSVRGSHNCPSCNQGVLDAIATFSVTQNSEVFLSLDCSCREQWLDHLDLEQLSFGSCIDF
jgi:radical SAM enzyme (TIGR01210 family)